MNLWDPSVKPGHRPSRFGIRRLLSALWSLVYALPGYRFTLAGRTPKGLSQSLLDPWPGNADRGSAIGRGEFAFGGETVCGDAAVWEGADVGGRWLEAFHGFGWLGDLHMIGSEAAKRRARMLVADWIAHNPAWSLPAWRGDVLGRRLAAWLGQYEFFCAGADDDFRALVLASIARQARHLSRALPHGPGGARMIAAAKGLVTAALCLPGHERRLARGIRFLEQELPRQVLADGGHIERSPSLQLGVLRDLVDVRAALVAARREVPGALQAAIDRMAPMLRFFRHGDGGLALFNDSREEEGWLVDMVLTRAEAAGKPLSAAPHTGFQRLAANRTLVIADTGAPVAPDGLQGADGHAHAGTLAFEMSVGSERLIVNCGAHAGGNSAWRLAQRATAAHSTLVVDGTNSSEVSADGVLGRVPDMVACRRNEADGNVWIEASHDGYAAPFGLVHKRRLYLAAGGDDFRGEDSLLAVPAVPGAAAAGRRGRRKAVGGHRFAVRFHLHPRVSASLVQNGAAALLRLPGGTGWRLRASGGLLSLEESVYLGGGDGRPRRSEQIVVRGTVAAPEGNAPAARVKWALDRIAEKG